MTGHLRGPSRRTPPRRDRDEDGTGLVSTVIGVGAFLAFMLLAAHVLVGLHARSVVGAAAFDAVRVVSGAEAGQRAGAVARAEADARAGLGRMGDRARFEWRVDGEMVEVRVTAPAPSLLPVVAGGPIGGSTVEQTVRLRVERPR